MKVKSDTEYIAKTGHTIDLDGSIPLDIKSELVRCKDCINAKKLECNISSYKCVHPQWEDSRYGVYEEDFCSYGERKENERARKN